MCGLFELVKHVIHYDLISRLTTLWPEEQVHRGDQRKSYG